MGAPLSPSEIARRAEIAARAANGAVHQDEMQLPRCHHHRLTQNCNICNPQTPQDPLGDGSYRGPDERPLPSRIEPEISPVDVWVMTETGLRRWRPIIDQLTVTPLPNGERILDIGGHRLRLNEALAAHVARLLSPSVDQEGR